MISRFVYIPQFIENGNAQHTWWKHVLGKADVEIWNTRCVQHFIFLRNNRAQLKLAVEK